MIRRGSIPKWDYRDPRPVRRQVAAFHSWRYWDRPDWREWDGDRYNLDFVVCGVYAGAPTISQQIERVTGYEVLRDGDNWWLFQWRKHVHWPPLYDVMRATRHCYVNGRGDKYYYARDIARSLMDMCDPRCGDCGSLECICRDWEDGLRSMRQETLTAASHDTDYISTYFLLNPMTDLVKIGRSVNIPKRKRSLETQGGVALILVHSLPVDAESFYHGLYSEHRRLGEWFDTAILADEIPTPVDCW